MVELYAAVSRRPAPLRPQLFLCSTVAEESKADVAQYGTEPVSSTGLDVCKLCTTPIAISTCDERRLRAQGLARTGCVSER